MPASIQKIQAVDIGPLVSLAASDNHCVLYPTHVIRKDGQVAGYVSVCATPIVNVWLHTQKVEALDSVRLLGKLDDYMRMIGQDSYIMPCAKTSPFYPNMERLGFTVLGENVWHLKNLKGA